MAMTERFFYSYALELGEEKLASFWRHQSTDSELDLLLSIINHHH